jgi:hypothetical protein
MRGIKEIALRLETPLARRIVLALFIAVAIVFTFVPFIRFLRHGTDFDYRTWYEAAQAVLQHRDIYPRNNTFTFMYPPPCALALALPALLGKPTMILLLCLLNSFAWILCIRFTLSLVNERRFPITISLLPNLILIVFTWSSYHLGQPSLILLTLMLGAFVSLRGKYQVLSGVLIAAAVALKAFPFLAIVYLIYRRYWTATISLLASLFVFLLILPLPFRGISQTLADLHSWQSGMLRYQPSGIAQRAGRGYSWKNQSLIGLANRMLRPVSVNDEGEPTEFKNFADFSFKAINAVILGSAVLLGLWFIGAITRRRARGDNAFEFAALLILILLFTPLAYGYLFSWLMLPLALLTRRVLDAGSVIALISMLIATTLLIATGISTRAAQIYGSVFFAALALYFGVTIELWRGRRGVPIPAAP